MKKRNQKYLYIAIYSNGKKYDEKKFMRSADFWTFNYDGDTIANAKSIEFKRCRKKTKFNKFEVMNAFGDVLFTGQLSSYFGFCKYVVIKKGNSPIFRPGDISVDVL